MGDLGRAAIPPSFNARALLTDLYHSAVRAAAPEPAVERALSDDPPEPASAPWIIALGKAAYPMAAAAVRILERTESQPAGGIVVAPDPTALDQPFAISHAPIHDRVAIAFGDHPSPGAGSMRAAGRIAEVAQHARGSAECWVLLSGGATSLAGAPIVGIPAYDLAALYELLLGSGLDISAMNTVRKRFSRWGAGRLAAALAPSRVRVLVISDVIGDDLAAIGSGPCVPDDTTAVEVRRLLVHADLWERTPESIRTHLARAEGDAALETPKSGDACFRNVDTRIIANNQTALEGAAKRALALGIQPHTHDVPLSGNAVSAGREIVRMLAHGHGDSFGHSATIASHRFKDSDPLNAPTTGTPTRCHIIGGETVLQLFKASEGSLGGRCQELTLSAAREMNVTRARGLTLLAAGTDGRDGPTDAAGAIVDGTTWERIRSSGRDPDDDLERHNSYHALDSAGALLRTGLSGTNVMDVVIGVNSEQ